MESQETEHNNESWHKDKQSMAYEGPIMSLLVQDKDELDLDLQKQANLITHVLNHALRDVGVEISLTFHNIQDDKKNPDRDRGYFRFRLIKPKTK